MEFRKVNELQVDIYEEGEKIGHAEKHGSGYWIEVFYTRKHFKEWDKERIEGWIEMTHRARVAHILLSVKRLEKYENWEVKF